MVWKEEEVDVILEGDLEGGSEKGPFSPSSLKWSRHKVTLFSYIMNGAFFG